MVDNKETQMYILDGDVKLHSEEAAEWFYKFIKDTNTGNLAVMAELVSRANQRFPLKHD